MSGSRRPSVRFVAGLLSVLAIVAGAAPVAARTPVRPAAAPLLQAIAGVNACRLDIYGVPLAPVDNADVTITVKRGATTTFKQTIASTGGQLVGVSICPALFHGGDTIKLAANGQSRTITVPKLTARIQPATKRVSGTVLAGGMLTITLWNCQLSTDAGCRGIVNGEQPTVSGAGAWSMDLSSHDEWKPGFSDYLDIDWSPVPTGEGDHFYLDQLQDHATVRVGSAAVKGAARYGSTVKLALVAPGGAVRGTASVKASGIAGAWSATLRSSTGSRVKVRMGDTLRTNLFKTRTQPGASIKAIDLRATVLTDGATAVNGNVRCAAGRRVGVLLHEAGSGSGTYYEEGIAGPDGRFAFTIDTLVPVGWVVDAHCPNAQFLDQVAFDRTVAP